METQQTHKDLRNLLVMVLDILPKSDERHQLAQQIASRHGMVELLDDRMGVYEGGDG
ncbi:MAG: hypothetical protein HOP04_00550 [Methylophilaceae bacterium]|nr:hypothetical protein [Methylophilaceae bacterium]